ncbi:RNA polymerase sigma-70 factor (ECF subfamily) [Mesonia hippocampi]|uniref:RNA polymerase sigma-70 factor (ECF subfamily) n=1 Tax=Mesonia hippocampi TaxID=1628250 RepID=A0A840EMC6_9FLAO|nr:sigma-70 family RNA polymerase sigma factor [Mesonia hippocampi]MBB4119539.1 RNA polymerase sigma-70 factor (ECF subfamily) [Mesonia hippocampi]
MENKKFIEKLKKGNQKAFKKAYLLYYPKLILSAKKFNFKFLSPDDFAQETFLKLYQNKHLLKTDVLFDKQLYSICKNNIINHLKREQKVIPLNNHYNTFEDEDDANTQTLLEHRKQEFFNLIKQLPEQQQKIYVLHKVEQYTYQEIMEHTGLSKKTIANHIYLANKFLQKKVVKT